MFQFGEFPLLTEHREPRRARDGKSYSGILGSKAACAYPRLIAACYALHRLLSRTIHQVAWRVGLTRKPSTHSAPNLCTAIIMSHIAHYALHLELWF